MTLIQDRKLLFCVRSWRRGNGVRHIPNAFLPFCHGGKLGLRVEPIGGIDVKNAALVCYCCV